MRARPCGSVSFDKPSRKWAPVLKSASRPPALPITKAADGASRAQPRRRSASARVVSCRRAHPGRWSAPAAGSAHNALGFGRQHHFGAAVRGALFPVSARPVRNGHLAESVCCSRRQHRPPSPAGYGRARSALSFTGQPICVVTVSGPVSLRPAFGCWFLAAGLLRVWLQALPRVSLQQACGRWLLRGDFGFFTAGAWLPVSSQLAFCWRLLAAGFWWRVFWLVCGLRRSLRSRRPRWLFACSWLGGLLSLRRFHQRRRRPQFFQGCTAPGWSAA